MRPQQAKNGDEQTTNTAQAAVQTTPEALRAEAAGRHENELVIARRITEAAAERQSAAREYDHRLEVFALGNGEEPSRARIGDAEAKLAGLVRIQMDNQTAIATLEANAKELEIRQLGPSELARIAIASKDSEGFLAAYTVALRAAKEAEARFYNSLVSLRNGDYRAVPDRARAAYSDLFERAEGAAIEVMYQPDFNALNHGYPVMAGYELQFTIGVRRGERNARLSALRTS